jgi:hypothetical protein
VSWMLDMELKDLMFSLLGFYFSLLELYVGRM